MYDLFASEYHYTIDQFLDLTMRQVSGLHLKIRIRQTKTKLEDFNFHAQVNRVEINLPSLENVLNLKPKETFRGKNDLILEEYAKKRVEEMRRNADERRTKD